MQVIKITICLPRVDGSLRLPPLTVGSWASYSQSIEGRLLSVIVQKSESFVCIILYIYILYIFLCVVIWQNDLFLYFISSFYVSKGSTYKGSCSMCSDLWLILLTFAYMFVFTMCFFMHVLTLIFFFFFCIFLLIPLLKAQKILCYYVIFIHGSLSIHGGVSTVYQ